MSLELPLNLNIRPLNVEDIDEVNALKELGFPPSERCSREKLIYRLRVCPELASGLFIRDINSLTVYDKLIGHVIGTKIDGDFITEESMEMPTPVASISANGIKKGHVESSSTVGIHSVVIHPDYQKKNLATMLMQDYIQGFSNEGAGEKIAIIAKEDLIRFYNRLGFITKGKSQCEHGCEEWFDLHCPLIPEDDK